MPKMTGERLAQEILSIRRDIPIILCTGFGSGMTEQRMRAMGIEGFIRKPIIPSQLSELVIKMLDKV